MADIPRFLRKALPQVSADGVVDAAASMETEQQAASIHLAATPNLDEAAELDRLYQEALDAMEAVETELNRTNEILHGKTDAEEHQAVAGSIESTASASSIKKSGAPQHSVVAQGMRATPAQIIEAALFVGGNALTIKRLCTLLKNEFDQDFVEATVEQLNRQYADEHRPYEIRFGTGGYRMELRETFAAVQNRVFGIGPKDVKLSQEALEVLSLIAYQQPVTKEAIDAHAKETGGSILRQLLQRQLVVLRRDSGEGNEVTYHTTPRFLQVFGLADLSELPQSEELSFK